MFPTHSGLVVEKLRTKLYLWPLVYGRARVGQLGLSSGGSKSIVPCHRLPPSAGTSKSPAPEHGAGPPAMVPARGAFQPSFTIPMFGKTKGVEGGRTVGQSQSLRERITIITVLNRSFCSEANGFILSRRSSRNHPLWEEKHGHLDSTSDSLPENYSSDFIVHHSA
jgi:hypothetical protein